MLKKYLDYLKNNPKGYWFKTRLFGWGWTPATWQGWTVVIAYVFLLLFFSLKTGEEPSDFLPLLVLITAALLLICLKKGEKPRWHWGWPKKK